MEDYRRLEDGTVLVRANTLRSGDFFKVSQSQHEPYRIVSIINGRMRYRNHGFTDNMSSNGNQWVILISRNKHYEDSIHGQSELIEGESPTVGNH